jgi:signal transduction histidine kinase
VLEGNLGGQCRSTGFTTLAGQAVIALRNARLFTEVRNGHQQLKELSQRLLEMQETDRRHIARELHDEVGQILTGLQITLEMAGHAADQHLNSTLANALALVNDLMGHIRRLSLDLRPSLLDDLGLFPTFLWYFERYTATTGVHVHFHHDGLAGQRFVPQVETAAYRIVQEALTNVARHAKVDQALVYACCIPDALLLKIHDTGRGFDPGTAMRAGTANGLMGMRERVSLLGGALSIESRAGTGTCIIAELRLEAISDHGSPHDRYNDRPDR